MAGLQPQQPIACWAGRGRALPEVTGRRGAAITLLEAARGRGLRVAWPWGVPALLVRSELPASKDEHPGHPRGGCPP